MDINYTPEVGAVLAEVGLFEWPKAAADGAAGTATAETSIGLLGPGPNQIAIGAVQFHTSAALTANDANFATITVSKRTNGGAATTLATATTQTVPTGGTGNWTAFSNVTIPVTSGAFVSPGDSITVTITKSGSGVVVPQGQLAVFPKIG